MRCSYSSALRLLQGEGEESRPLAGHPLIAYSIAAALKSEVFDDVIVSTNSPHYSEIARRYGASVPFLRPDEFSSSASPDIHWVQHSLRFLSEQGRDYESFAILRPTCPFRLAGTIRRAWATFSAHPFADSLRAIERCSQHPGKMWVVRGGYLLPLLPIGPAEQPWHSSAYQVLPEIFVQNASLEIARTEVVQRTATISGQIMIPFCTEGYEGFDINTDLDFDVAEVLIAQGKASLPEMQGEVL